MPNTLLDSVSQWFALLMDFKLYEAIVIPINSLFWNYYFLLTLLSACGVWFTWKLKFVQLRYFTHMFAVMRGSTHGNKSGISSFGALCTSLSARVGTGNLAGVAIAITMGGPGAVFWMWVIAFVGMAIGFAESALGQLYKVRDDNGEFRGGPAYYIQQGLNKRWLAVAFSMALFFGYGFIFNSVQANSITDALNHAYGFEPLYVGIVICILAALIVVGGLRSIARFSQMIVPFMAVGYVLVAVGITLWNIELVPTMIYHIISSAFGFDQVAGGTFAAAIQHGINRGLYSNEAGAGSVPHAAASAAPVPNHPATQGFVQMLGVFVDTMILCTCTAIIVLLAGGEQTGEMEGIRLTQDAMTFHLGAGGEDFVAAAIALFSFTSVVANYAYGESNLHMFKLDNKIGRTIYTAGYLSVIIWGSAAALPKVWAMADMALGLMTVINVIAIILMTPTVVNITKDYINQRNANKIPEYKTGNCEIQGQSEKGIWD